MKNHVKFTVIVPTRQRADVLKAALTTIVAQDYDNLQILVSDNYSNDATRDVVETFRDPRIVYLNTGKRLSMSHNWEFALSHICSGWVTIVGDDDGLLPGAISRVAEIALEYDVRAIGSRNAAYTWPHSPDQPYGKLTVSLKHGVEIHDPKTSLSRIFRGRSSYSSLPMLYTGGFVDYTLVEQARNINGKFYHSMIPDVYSAIVFAKLISRFAFCNEPLAVGGSSVHSAGTSHFANSKSGNVSEAPANQFFSEPNIPFHKELVVSDSETVPPSIELLAYESLLQTEHIEPSCKSLTTHADQLAIILGRAKRRHRQKITAWGDQFGERHTLNMAAISRKAAYIRWREKLLKAIMSLAEKRNTRDITGSASLPIKDVYDAAIITSTILNLHAARK